MPIILGGNKFAVQTVNGYTDALTLGPDEQIQKVWFTVSGAAAFCQVAKLDKARQPYWDAPEIPLGLGPNGFENVVGIRFRSAVTNVPATISATAFYYDDPSIMGNPAGQDGFDANGNVIAANSLFGLYSPSGTGVLLPSSNGNYQSGQVSLTESSSITVAIVTFSGNGLILVSAAAKGNVFNASTTVAVDVTLQLAVTGMYSAGATGYLDVIRIQVPVASSSTIPAVVSFNLASTVPIALNSGAKAELIITKNAGTMSVAFSGSAIAFTV